MIIFLRNDCLSKDVSSTHTAGLPRRSGVSSTVTEIGVLPRSSHVLSTSFADTSGRYFLCIITADGIVCAAGDFVKLVSKGAHALWETCLA